MIEQLRGKVNEQATESQDLGESGRNTTEK